jgi:hypothetical protein
MPEPRQPEPLDRAPDAVEGYELTVFYRNGGRRHATLVAGVADAGTSWALTADGRAIWRSRPDRGRSELCLLPGSNRLLVARGLGFDVVTDLELFRVRDGSTLSVAELEAELRSEGVDVEGSYARTRALIEQARAERAEGLLLGPPPSPLEGCAAAQVTFLDWTSLGEELPDQKRAGWALLPCGRED